MENIFFRSSSNYDANASELKEHIQEMFLPRMTRKLFFYNAEVNASRIEDNAFPSESFII